MSVNAMVVVGIAMFVVLFVGAGIAFVRSSRSKPREYWAEDFEVRSGPPDEFAP